MGVGTVVGEDALGCRSLSGESKSAGHGSSRGTSVMARVRGRVSEASDGVSDANEGHPVKLVGGSSLKLPGR